jgi:hypothetical protein
MDLITSVTRLLLDNSTFSEAVTLQRCARLLAGDLASWVIVDMEREGELRRQFVIGPHDEPSEELARNVRAVDPPPGTLTAQVHAAGRSAVLAHTEDSGILGATPDGTPLLMLLGATSLLSRRRHRVRRAHPGAAGSGGPLRDRRPRPGRRTR